MLSRSRRRSGTSAPRRYLPAASMRSAAARSSFHAFDEHYAFFVVNFLQAHFDNLAIAGSHGPAYEACFDGKFAMASIDEDRHAHAAGPAKIEEAVHGRACRPPGIENIVHQEDVLIVNPKRYFARMHDRLRRYLGEIIAIERDVQCSHGDFHVLDAVHGARDPLRQRHAPAANSDECQIRRATAFLDDLMRQAL